MQPRRQPKETLCPHRIRRVERTSMGVVQKEKNSVNPLSGPMIQEQALIYAEQLNKPEFKASNGWLESFSKRNNLSFHKVSGESADVPQETVDSWTARLPHLIEGYSPRDIFNMDETGVFYRALPDKSYAAKGEDCKGGKKSKDRITAVLCTNMNGTEKLKAIVIGKAAKPRCFNNVNLNSLPVLWRNNKKAWMTTELFTDWLRDFDRKMRQQKRKVLMFIDNAPTHPPNAVRLTNTKLIFFPPKTTSKLQPLDQGIIAAMKKTYRKRLLRAVLSKAEDESLSANEIARTVNVLDACHWIGRSWNEVTAETITSCFRKAGFPTNAANEADEVNEDTELDRLVTATGRALVSLNFYVLRTLSMSTVKSRPMLV
ncbi:tigger transposable element-derived protein 4-like [Ptychodera flava]|uniref:tigger transposable element-derived protein 4-like n=1 Tax=Ptychodera flava TaxID=63121 RepID=UPI003969FA14